MHVVLQNGIELRLGLPIGNHGQPEFVGRVGFEVPHGGGTL